MMANRAEIDPHKFLLMKAEMANLVTIHIVDSRQEASDEPIWENIWGVLRRKQLLSITEQGFINLYHQPGNGKILPLLVEKWLWEIGDQVWYIEGEYPDNSQRLNMVHTEYAGGGYWFCTIFYADESSAILDVLPNETIKYLLDDIWEVGERCREANVQASVR